MSEDRLFEWLSEVEHTGALLPLDISIIRELITGYGRYQNLVAMMEDAFWGADTGFGWGASRRLRLAAGLDPEPEPQTTCPRCGSANYAMLGDDCLPEMHPFHSEGMIGELEGES